MYDLLKLKLQELNALKSKETELTDVHVETRVYLLLLLKDYPELYNKLIDEAIFHCEEGIKVIEETAEEMGLDLGK